MLISAKDIINQSIALYKNNYELFLRYMLLLFIPTGIMAIASSLMGSFIKTLALYGLSLPLIIYVLLVLAGSLVSVWITIAFVRTLSARYQNQETVVVKEQLQKSSHLVLPAILISILVSLIVLGGVILLIIPGIIFALWFAFSFYAVALDEHKVTDSLKISRDLVKKRWWGVLWRLLAPSIVFALTLFAVEWIISLPFVYIISYFTPLSLGFKFTGIVFALLSTLVSLAFTPLSTLVPVILYHELKKTPVTENQLTEPPQI